MVIAVRACAEYHMAVLEKQAPTNQVLYSIEGDSGVTSSNRNGASGSKPSLDRKSVELVLGIILGDHID